MKKKLKALIAMMSVCAIGVVGSTFAFARQQATSSGTTGKYDQAISLYWGDGESDLTLDNCSDLQAGTAQYRYFSVMPQSTKTVTGTVTVTFNLAQSSGDYHLNGLTVKVYRADVAISDDNIETYAVEGNLKATLDKDNTTKTDTFAVSASSDNNSHTTAKYYAVEVKYDGSYVANKALGGSLTISQSFGA